MMSFVPSEPVIVWIILLLGDFPSLSMGQTVAQEERFETCCKNVTLIADASYCNYRKLELMTDAEFGVNNTELETGVKIAHDNKNQTSVNEAWGDFLPCLNNGQDNRDCCLEGMPNGVRGKACSPLCNGLLRTKDMDIKGLNAMRCHLHLKVVLGCALKSD